MSSLQSVVEPTFDVIDLGRMSYAQAYQTQVQHLDDVLAAREHAESASVGRVLLVEHDPPVITITRRPGAPSHLLASREDLRAAGIEIEETDRGGDITYHGPGQLVVYPILDLNRLKLRLHDYMRLLESAVIDTCAHFGVSAMRDPCATGVWVPRADVTSECGSLSAKICAMGVRIRRWISMHGLALNVTTNLDHFGFIVPCGLVGRGVTSLHNELGDRTPSMEDVKRALVESLRARLREHMDAVRSTPGSIAITSSAGAAPPGSPAP